MDYVDRLQEFTEFAEIAGSISKKGPMFFFYIDSYIYLYIFTTKIKDQFKCR